MTPEANPPSKPGPSVLSLRVREAWGRYFVVVCLVALVVATAGGVVVANGLDEARGQTELRSVEVMEATGTFDHRATVRRDSRAFARGETLENRPTYYTSATPVLDGTHRVTYTADGSAEMAAETRVQVVLREEDDGTVLWQRSEVLTTASAESLEPGEPLETEFSVNVSALDREADAIREELGAAPGSVESTVVVRTRLDGTVDGREVGRTMENRMELTVDDGTYAVGDNGSSVAVTRTERVPVTPEPPLVELAAGGLLAGLGIVVLLASVVGRLGGVISLSAAEEHALVRSEFEEWITVAAVPDRTARERTVPVSSLQGLVDLAIDTDDRVLQDAETGRYVLLAEEYRYVFTPSHVASEEGPDQSVPTPAGSSAGADDGGDAPVATGSVADGAAGRPSPSTVEAAAGTAPDDGGPRGSRSTGGRWTPRRGVVQLVVAAVIGAAVASTPLYAGIDAPWRAAVAAGAAVLAVGVGYVALRLTVSR